MVTTTGDAVRPDAGHDGAHDHDKDYLTADKSLLSWLLTVDHKRIGLMYLASIIAFFFIGGLFAILIRLELLYPAGKLLTDNQYNRVFTLHGAVMIFLFLIPSIPAALGNFILPLQLGTKDVAFPRLNLASFYIYVFGAVCLVLAIVAGGLDTGWTFYTPYSSAFSEYPNAMLYSTFGVFVLGFSSILTGLNFIVTIHKMRAPGMTWRKMPLFLWALYATSLIQILATPVLAITLLLLLFERFFAIGIFDPALGGDPVLFQHFFWFYSHPAVYIMVLPGFGVISEVIATHSRKRIFGYVPIAVSSVAIALIGFLVWGHHMFVSGQSGVASVIFSFLTFAIAVPTAIKVFSWVATLYKGSIRLNTPMLHSLSFIFLFVIGGVTGLFLATLATDVHLHDTYFVVAHFHYVMVGGTLVAFLAALHHWWPKMFGKSYNEFWGRIAAVLVFLGFNVTFFVQFIMGTKGMPRRYHTYAKMTKEMVTEFQFYHKISTFGSWILLAGLLITAFYLLSSLLFRKKDVGPNPWNAKSLEWETQSPPITHNFATDPVCLHGPYEYDEIDRSADKGH
ncbi:MAG: cytochrome c oxidase subunit I [Deltaproteobacteria bacterium]|nr:MAG: cytochrome c oxidase subunit I [Deltaproteobacteria bacterium]